MYSTMTLLKPLNEPNLLLPYEQYYIQSLHREGKLIPEQSPGETNPHRFVWIDKQFFIQHLKRFDFMTSLKIVFIM